MPISPTPECPRTLLKAAFLCSLTLAAYWPALHGGFILDDDVFLTHNALIRAADGLGRFWFTRQAADYWPLTSTSLWVEWRLWGPHPLGYHVTNLVLHLASALLLWRILFRLGVPGAFVSALIFALHPVNVESVAWITQRKNTMAMLWFLLAILAFAAAELPGGRPKPADPQGDADLGPQEGNPEGAQNAARGKRLGALSLAAFALALLSKGSVAPLPLVLLGIIAWRRSPSIRDGWRLLPFVAAAGLFTAVNVWFQRHGNGDYAGSAGIAERLLGACAVPWFYLSKVLLPVDLLFIYPRWHIDPGNLAWWLPPIAAIGVTFFLLRFKGRGIRGCLFGWGYYWAMLLPVMGLADIRFMRLSFVADHYAHLAMIGVIVPVCALCAGAGARRAKAAPLGAATAAIAACVLAFLTWRQCLLYRDARTLYTAALAGNPASWLLHNNLGVALQGDGLREQAMAEYREAVRLNPEYAEAHNNLGALLSAMGMPGEALLHCEEAVRLKPDYADANNNLGVLLARQGRTAEAAGLFERAAAERPDYADPHSNLGIILQAEGRAQEARAEFEIADSLKHER